MQSVGEMLRLERLRQGRDLEEAAVKTRINSKFLEAIEANDTGSLPGDFFYRSFVRQYARYLGIDDSEVDAALAEVAPSPAPQGPPASPIFVPPVHTGLREQGIFGKRFPTASVGLLIIVVLACSAVYSLWQRGRDSEAIGAAAPAPASPPPPAAAPEPAQTAPAQQNPAQTSAEPAPAKVEPVPQAQTPPPPAPPQAAAPAPGIIGSGPLSLEIVAKTDAWVQVDVDGKTVTTRILQQGQSRAFAGSQTITLLTGNAGGIELKVNGKPVGAAGPVGQIRRLSITPQGYEIRNPRQTEEENP